jgi:hypothetical protein
MSEILLTIFLLPFALGAGLVMMGLVIGVIWEIVRCFKWL